jgi:putative transposase
VPPELQQQVHATVQETKARSGWSAQRTLAALGISRGSYYRWLQEEAWAKEQADVRSVQAFEALPEERSAVLAYARRHPEIRHRELAWRMIDEEVAFLSPSTVYRILREANLMCRQRGRKKRYREEIEKATKPDERWGTDLMYVTVSGVNYFYHGFH